MSNSFFDEDHEEIPQPEGELQLKVLAKPQETNLHGDISASWVIAQMEQAAEITASCLAQGRCVTVAVSATDFLCPVSLGSQVEVYAQLLAKGRSSITLGTEVWISATPYNEQRKVADAEFVMVALDNQGRIRQLPS